MDLWKLIILGIFHLNCKYYKCVLNWMIAVWKMENGILSANVYLVIKNFKRANCINDYGVKLSQHKFVPLH